MKNLYPTTTASANRTFGIIAAMILGIFMSATGAKAQCSTFGTGDINGNVPFGNPINWANPNRVEISDDLYARVRLDPGETSKYLMVADFNYALPPGAVVQGIEVRVEAKEDPMANVEDASIRLMKAGTATGADRAGAGIWEVKDTLNTYGGSTDLWGTTWTAADINDPGFGVLVSVRRTAGPTQLRAYIDQVQIVVYYEDESCLLPIELTAFGATMTTEHNVELDWSIPATGNQDYFSIERSTDGLEFSSIGTVEGDAHSLDYQYVDMAPAPGSNYYRLAQLDVNGQIIYSQVAMVLNNVDGGVALQAYPNPASDVLNLSVVTASGKGQAALYDITGRVVQELDLAGMEAGTASMDVAHLERGVYILRLSENGSIATRKVILQ